MIPALPACLCRLGECTAAPRHGRLHRPWVCREVPWAASPGLALLGVGSSSRAKQAALHGDRCPVVPGAHPIAIACPTAPDGDTTMKASARVPSCSWQMSSAERKGLRDTGEIFLQGREKKQKEKRRKKKEGGCPSQLIAAWHLCPGAGVQARREQARCHRSRWARRQAAPSPRSCHSSGRGAAV